MRLLVGIATVGRQELLRETLEQLAGQSRLPDQVVLCSAAGHDIDARTFESLPFPTSVIYSPIGSCPQRNAILRQAADFDAVVFFDDDFFPERTYLANAEALLARHPNVVVATGCLIEDGIHGPGLSPEYARRALAAASPRRLDDSGLMPHYGAYGCNLVVRLAPVRAHAVFFDEALPLYAWQEDVDFTRRLAAYGEVVGCEALTGIHLGVKRGRTSGLRFGYSQIANPVYLIRKGTMARRYGLRLILRNLTANAVRFFRPEPHIDRAGRLKGNMLALRDLITGRLHPGRIIEMQ